MGVFVDAATRFGPTPAAAPALEVAVAVAVAVGSIVAVGVGVLVGIVKLPAEALSRVLVGLASTTGCATGGSVAVASAAGGSVATGGSVAATGGSVASAPAAPERGAGAHAARIRDSTIITEMNFKNVGCFFACISPLFLLSIALLI